MFYISHRGNINGPNKKEENKPEYINAAIQNGYDVEIDVRFKNSQFYLGHDFAEYKVDESFLLNKKIWCHAKDVDALHNLKKINAHFFWHQQDDVTLTSKGYFWTYPGKLLTKNSICVLPEVGKDKKIDCAGICSDFIKDYKK
ncbi:hypothetical protein OAX49_04980 [Candidatus Pelagibacter sp.]|nr:hypothetical protein [Candidatus Pelagibacter sp.]